MFAISPRRIVGLVMALVAILCLTQLAGKASAQSGYYVSPTGAGSMSGDSMDNAAPQAALPGLVKQAGPGETVHLLADAGPYIVSKPFNLSHGGGNGVPVLIKGIDRSGRPAAARFVGIRAKDWVPGAVKGSEVFRLLRGADDLSFENLAFADVNTCFRIADDVSGLSIRNVSAQNVHRFLDDYATKGAASATVTGLQVRDVQVDGFAKGVIRVQYDSSGILIENVRGDSRQIDGANYAIGVHLRGRTHDVVLRNVAMRNILDTTNRYHNGDGFATERDVYNVLFENTSAINNSDAGYDLKSRSTKLVDTLAEGNTRNYRFWADDTVAHNITGIDPLHHGGANTVANVWVQDGASVAIKNSTFVQGDSKSPVLDLKGTARVALAGVSATMGRRSLVRQGKDAELTGSFLPAPSMASDR